VFPITFQVYYNENEHTFIEKDGIVTEYVKYPTNDTWTLVGNFWVRKYRVNSYYLQLKDMYDSQNPYAELTSGFANLQVENNPYK
jgi:hypothetical protein